MHQKLILDSHKVLCIAMVNKSRVWFAFLSKAFAFIKSKENHNNGFAFNSIKKLEAMVIIQLQILFS